MEFCIYVGRHGIWQYLSVVVLLYLTGLLIIRLVNWKVKDFRRQHSARKTTVYTIALSIVVISVIYWLEGIKSLAVVASVIGASIVIALQEVILCFAGWLLILFKRPFTLGDRIEIGNVKGDVIDVRMFQIAVLEVGNWVGAEQSTGRVVHIPNSTLFKDRLFNYTKGFEFIWNEIKIVITFESNWKKAQEIILRHALPEVDKIQEKVSHSIRRMSHEYMIHYEKFTPIVYTNIIGHGIELSLRYLTVARERRSTQDRICKQILDDFAKERDINFAYQTYRIVK